MKNCLSLACVLGSTVFTVSAQCPVTDVITPAEVCINSNFVIENNSSAGAFEWDMCPVDLSVAPTQSKVMNVGVSSSIDLTIIEDSGLFYGFVVDATSDALIRLDFGASRDNTPVMVNLGNVDGLFNFPNSIRMVNENDRWLGIVANGEDEKIILLDFGATVESLPTASVLHTRSGGGFASIAVASVSSVASALLVAEFNSRQVLVVNFPDGFLQPFSSQQIIAIAGSSPIDLDVLKQCDDLYAVVLSFENKKLYRIDFGNSFENAGVVSEYPLTLDFEPYRVSLVREGDTAHAFATSTGGGLSRLTFGNDIRNAPTVSALGTLGVLSNSRTLHIDSKEGRWLAFMINFSSGDMFRLSFLADCAVFPVYSTAQTPGYVKYGDAGDQKIAVTAVEADGTVLTSSFEVNVSEYIAPDFSIVQRNNCVNNEVQFEAINATSEITAYEWTFGDGNSSTASAPSHNYSAADTYMVSLSVVDVNSCRNIKQIEAAVFDAPQSDFDPPSDTPLCTNQDLLFANTTLVDLAANPYFHWYVNGVKSSEAKDLTYAFGSTGPHTIKLVSGIPGCESESEYVLDPLIKGPLIDFSFTGICLGQSTAFVNSSDGDASSFEWDFGDGNTATDLNAENQYLAFGSYEVTLKGTGSSGCQNEKKKTVVIKSNPLIDFGVSSPPLSCSGVPSPFDNQTSNADGDEIIEWRWIFEDPNSFEVQEIEDPYHTFASSGTYPVSLTATTAAGCTATLEKEITIHPSPSTAFTHTPACEDVPVNFTGPADASIESSYWEFGTSYSYDASPTHTFAAPGDYALYAQFHGTNGCISTIEKTIHVPVPLTPDFSVIKNCVDHRAIFTDITSGVDAVTSRAWDFGDGLTETSSPVNQLFAQEGTAPVTLHVIAQSGCAYATTKQVQILAAPVAEFTASPETGAYPLDVMFINTSLAADRFEWRFFDGTGNISTAESPAYTFSTLGTFDVTLTAYTAQQCEDSFTKSITTVAPLPDADIEMITLVEQPDGSTKLIVTIQNKGNTILKDLPMAFDFAGDLSLSQNVEDPIMPGAQFNFILNSGILNAENLAYVCVALDVENDLSPDDNRSCSTLQTDLFVFPAYPNPATEGLRLEWLSLHAETVTVSVTDRTGRTMFRESLPSAPGLNSHNMDLHTLPAGLYLLLVDDGLSQQVQRVVVEP